MDESRRNRSASGRNQLDPPVCNVLVRLLVHRSRFQYYLLSPCIPSLDSTGKRNIVMVIKVQYEYSVLLETGVSQSVQIICSCYSFCKFRDGHDIRLAMGLWSFLKWTFYSYPFRTGSSLLFKIARVGTLTTSACNQFHWFAIQMLKKFFLNPFSALCHLHYCRLYFFR